MNGDSTAMIPRLLVLLGGVAGDVASFLPWVRTSYTYELPPYASNTVASGTDTAWHGPGIVAALLLGGTTLFLLLPLLGISCRGLREALPVGVTMPGLATSAGLAALLCTLIEMYTDEPYTPSFPATSGALLVRSNGPTSSAYIAVAAALVIVLGGFLMRRAALITLPAPTNGDV